MATATPGARGCRHRGGLTAADLLATGEVRPGLDTDEIGDVLWATNSPEFHLLLVDGRGWPPDRFERWLADSWRRLLLR